MCGLFTQERTWKLGQGDGNCEFYPKTPETLEHIFYNCRHAQKGWASIAIYFEPVPTNNYLTSTISLINIIDLALEKTPQSTARLYIIHQSCWTLWNHRNGGLYNNHSLRFSPNVTTERAREHLQVVTRYYDSKKKKRRMKNADLIMVPFQPTTNNPSNTQQHQEDDGTSIVEEDTSSEEDLI